MNNLEVLYDEKSEGILCGVKAVWILYKRGKWSLLEELGVLRSIHEPLFESFDLTALTPNVSGLLCCWLDVVLLLRLSPAVLDAALYMSNEYFLLMRGIRNSETLDCSV